MGFESPPTKHRSKKKLTFKEDVEKSKWVFLLAFILFAVMTALLFMLGSFLVGVFFSVLTIACGVFFLLGVIYSKERNTAPSDTNARSGSGSGKIKCPICDTEFSGMKCPTCGRSANPTYDLHKKRVFWGAVGAAVVFFGFIIGFIVIVLPTYKFYTNINNEMHEILHGDEENSNATKDPAAQVTLSPNEADPIISAINTVLSTTYAEGSYSTKLSGNSYAVSLTVDGVFDSLKSNKATVDEYTALGSSLADTVTNAGETKKVTLYVYDSADLKTILLTISNGKVLYDGTAEQDDSKKPSGVTKFQFDAVSAGMSYQDVVAVFGSNGTMDASADLGINDTSTSEIYTWKGENPYSSVTIIFGGGKLLSKSQIGLE